MRILLLILIWLLLGIPGVGWSAADFICRYPNSTSARRELGESSILIFWGPLNIVTYFWTGFAEHGFCITISSCEAKRQEVN